MIWFLSIVILLFILIQINSKVEFYKLREGKVKYKALVVEYRKEKSPMRNDFTKISYPYVKILNYAENDDLIKLKYTNNTNIPFEIGEEVDVFWHGGILYYWNAFDTGVMKHVPNSWIFWV